MRVGVGFIKAGSSKLGTPEEIPWRNEEEEFVVREFVNDGTEPWEDASDARRSLCVWSEELRSTNDSSDLRCNAQ
jgi:hypothetical protein